MVETAPWAMFELPTSDEPSFYVHHPPMPW
jgi:hypothetical protein